MSLHKPRDTQRRSDRDLPSCDLRIRFPLVGHIEQLDRVVQRLARLVIGEGIQRQQDGMEPGRAEPCGLGLFVRFAFLVLEIKALHVLVETLERVNLGGHGCPILWSPVAGTTVMESVSNSFRV